MPGGLTTHATLLTRISGEGDPAAWQEFCARYGEVIRGFVLRRGGQPAEADDVMQDVLISLTKAMPNFHYDPARGKFRSYLKTLVVRAVYRRTFQNRRAVQLEDIDEAVRAAGETDELDALWEVQWRQFHIRLAQVQQL